MKYVLVQSSRKVAAMLAAIFFLAATLSQSQTTVYNNLDTPAVGVYGESDDLIMGDELNLTQAGTLSTLGFTVYNADGNGGVINSGAMLIRFYDNSIPYTGGTLSNPLLASVFVNVNFGAGGLPDGYFDVATVNLSTFRINLPANILVTQEFSETSGTSTGFGGALFSDPDVGSSPETVYVNSSESPEGLYYFDGIPSQLGYEVKLSALASTNPVANGQSITALKNTATPITLTGSDPDGDTVTYQLVSTPTNGTLTGTAPNLVYLPNTNYLGSDGFAFLVTDGTNASAPALVNITVAGGLVIVPQFDSTITNDPNSAAIINTINQAIGTIEGLYGDNVTVNIRYQEMTSGLGQSETWIGSISYSSLLSALMSHSMTTNDAIALTNLPAGPNNPVNGASTVTLTLPNLRALGFNANPPTNYDAIISLNMSIINITRTSIDPSKYDLQAVVSHEMDEVLGSGSGLPGSGINVEDLFRYDSNGLRNFTTSGDDAFFSIDGGLTDLVRYNQNSTGDYGDFWSISAHTPVRIQDAYGTPGTTPNFTVEPIVLDVIGWDLLSAIATVPAPVIETVTHLTSTFTLTFSSVSNQTYQVQYEPALTANAWTNLGSQIIATNTTTAVSDSISTNTQRFYRVELVSGSTPSVPSSSSGSQEIVAPSTSVHTRYLHPASALQPVGKPIIVPPPSAISLAVPKRISN